ncbi:putative transmembrane protein [Gregarina niphandrodes]|uniref:Transmembrane protein n=1 Tax=Gregarina niphandrodes TaxID=110365 RepID=A0A023B7T4_GRENI|nr:putative transmembrane protein [Gregarina niphandrodes]EZG67685.1 putative transmembrane protein [Gregarina niphandrodes]|eukprot:XP_011130167.1 putative transmembrane protein [Gregarina niphandrodes]
MEELATALLWQLPGDSAFDDITQFGQLCPPLGDEVLIRLQRPNLLIKDSSAQPPCHFVANDHCKAAGAYKSPLSDNWIKADGTIVSTNDLPAGVLRLEESDSTIEFRARLRDEMKQFYTTHYPSAHHSEYMWAVSTNRYAVTVLTKAFHNLPVKEEGVHMHCEIDLIQSMAIFVGPTTVHQLKTIGYITMVSKTPAGVMKVTGKAIHKSDNAEYIHKSVISYMFVAIAIQKFQESIARILDKLVTKIPKAAMKDLNTLRLWSMHDVDINTDIQSLLNKAEVISEVFRNLFRSIMVFILRTYPSWIKWLCAIMTIVAGVFCSIVFKWQNKIDVKYCDSCETQKFEGALYQTQQMFIGESLSLPLYYLDAWFSGQKNKAPMFDFAKSADIYDKPIGPFWYWPICSAFDFTATLMIMTSLQITYAATVQMLRNFMVVLTAILQPAMLRKAVRIHEWLGVFVITIAMVLTAVPAFLSPDDSGNTDTGKVVLGIVLAIVGTSVQSVQLLLEEWFLRKKRSSPLRCVGWEGIGGLVYSFIAWPIYQKIGTEDVTGSWYASIHSGAISGITIVYLPMAAVFNIAGLATTLLGSGLLRGVCFAVRSPLTWIISLIVKWQDYENYSLASALTFCVGFALYINLIGFPHGHPVHRWMSKPVPCFCTNPELDEPYDIEDSENPALADIEAAAAGSPSFFGGRSGSHYAHSEV